MALNNNNEDSSHAKLIDDIDPVLLDFIQTKITSFVKWDLVRFFHENPDTADTIENIARYAGRNLSIVESELEDLTESEIMQKQMLNNNSVYSLSLNQNMRDLVEKFITACENQHFRVKVVYYVIRGMK